jgi:tRNA pseudouridine55 synthase
VIERQAREIEITELSATPTDTPTDYILDVHCSGGTYIRTLCADIGAALGCGGAMAALERTETGGFSIDRAHTVDELTEMTTEERAALLIPTESLFSLHPAISLPTFYERLCRSGCEIYLKKIKADLPAGTRVRICTEKGEFFALGEVREYPNGLAIKAIKTFSLETEQ